MPSNPFRGTKWEFGRSPTWSPFVVVLFGGRDLSDELLLGTLGLTVVPTPLYAPGGGGWPPHVAIACCGEWKAISSDWSYGFWHNQGTRPGLWKLAEEFRIFAYAMGDIDFSYSFHLFDEGELVRESLMYDGTYGVIPEGEIVGRNGQRELLFDTGERLAGEPSRELGPGGLAQDLVSLAASNGFRPGSAIEVHYWWIQRPPPAAGGEKAMMRTSWSDYRP